MISSISFYHRIAPVAFIWIIFCAGCAGSNGQLPVQKVAGRGTYRIAVFPVENLSGAKAPLKELRQTLTEKLEAEGFDILPDDSLNQFIARHRIRYIGGVDKDSAQAFNKEERVDAVLIPSLELYNDSFPPKIALTARLVSAADAPEILWMDNIGMAGDDSPGVFQVGLIRDARILAAKALRRLAYSLSRDFSTGFRDNAEAPEGKFPPKLFYRSDLDPGKQFRVVVLPFYNRSGRKYAGEIMALHFIRELRRRGNFHVIEPGLVRRELLQYRIVMEEGLSLSNAEVVYGVLQAGLIVTGKVMDYQDYQGTTGAPAVDFSTMILEKESGKVVLASDGHNTGDDRVIFFDFGKINTALGVATEMVRGIVDKIGTSPGMPAAAQSK